MHLNLDEIERRAVVLDLVDKKKPLVQRGQQPERTREDETDRRKYGGMSTNEVSRTDDEHRTNDEGCLEHIP